MNKKIIRSNTLNGSSLISRGGISTVFRLSDGSILKVFDANVLSTFREIGVDLERKILDAKKIPNAKEIIIPTAAAYAGDKFIGYTMPAAKGIDYNTFDSRLSLSEREDLFGYAKRHYSIESVLVRATDVIFPDLCTCDNIFFGKDGKPEFIDYDGLQVGSHPSYVMSCAMGEQIQYYIPKYWDGELFNKNLDKRSSIFLYFISALGINLATVGKINPRTGKVITVDDVFKVLNLDDSDICQKVWKAFQPNEENEFLRDDVFKMAEKYNLRIIGRRNDGVYLKQLVKK